MSLTTQRQLLLRDFFLINKILHIATWPALQTAFKQAGGVPTQRQFVYPANWVFNPVKKGLRTKAHSRNKLVSCWIDKSLDKLHLGRIGRIPHCRRFPVLHGFAQHTEMHMKMHCMLKEGLLLREMWKGSQSTYKHQNMTQAEGYRRNNKRLCTLECM